MPGGFMFSRKVISFLLPEIVERKDVQLLFTKVIAVEGGSELTEELISELKEFGFPVTKSRISQAIKSGGLHAILLALSKQKTDVSMIEIPEMINISDKVSIMRGEVTVKLFKQVMGDYTPTGHNADKLIAVLNDPSKEGEILTYLSLLDGREFAKRLSALAGRKFRVQTEAEWEQGRGSLVGANFTWTETKHSDEVFALRSLFRGYRGGDLPENRFGDNALRLVEDKKN